MITECRWDPDDCKVVIARVKYDRLQFVYSFEDSFILHVFLCVKVGYETFPGK